MKKISTVVMALILSISMSIAQPVSDMGVIPVGVTLSSILRLNIVSGGNIEFVVSTLDQYNDGINSGGSIAAYQTNFTISSSTNYDVNLYSDNANFVAEGATKTIALNNVGYSIESAGSGVDGANWNLIPSVVALSSTPETIINGNSGATPAAGSALQNSFKLSWRLGTKEGNMESVSLLEQGIAADRYVTNVILELVAK